MAIVIVFLLASCAGMGGQQDDAYEKAIEEGNYSLFVVSPADGGPDMAVLDIEGDPYELAPEEGAREMSRARGLSRREAITLADESLPGSGVMIKAVTGRDSVIVGYEIYPPPSQGTGPATAPGSEEAVLLPNLLRIDYAVTPTGRQRIRIISLPLSEPGAVPPK